MTDGAFDTCTPSPARQFPPNGVNVHISELDPSGSRLVWAACIGGPGRDDFANGLAVDAGRTTSTSFPTTPGALERRALDKRLDRLLTEIDRSGSRLAYSTFLGHGLSSRVALDSSGSVYAACTSPGRGFPTTPGPTAASGMR